MINIYPGQKIITKYGTVRTIALVLVDGTILAYGRDGSLEVVEACSDAWGGEHDLSVLMPAAIG